MANTKIPPVQTTSHLLMIRPVNFKFNTQTAANNKFQQHAAQEDVQTRALQEFDNFVALLRENGLDVIVIDDTPLPETPDSIFPNNWLSFHQGGEAFLYPMFSENRRTERRADILHQISARFALREVIDLSAHELQQRFLEGTGSMVLDREHKIAYACLSVRTDRQVLEEFCSRSGYHAMTFTAADRQGYPIYHTNVMMSIAGNFAVICLESIPDAAEREQLSRQIQADGKAIISITADQMNHFAGNMLAVTSQSGEQLLIMSEQAYSSLEKEQIRTLEQYCRLIYAPLYTIEKNGGGSARCMLAEIHLDEKINNTAGA